MRLSWYHAKGSFSWMDFREEEKKMRELLLLLLFLFFGWREESRKLAGSGCFFRGFIKIFSLQNEKTIGEENQYIKKKKKKTPLWAFFIYLFKFS